MDFILADETSVCRFEAWESNIELLQHEKSHCISDTFLKSFIGQNSKITQIDDMTNAIDDELPSLNIGWARVITGENGQCGYNRHLQKLSEL